MSTTNVTTPIPANITAEQVLTVLHNHEAMIKALCPALVSYEFESGDPAGEATYSVTDKKPIGQVSSIHCSPARRHFLTLVCTC